LKYVGEELEIFKNALNWRNYWSTFIHPHVRGKVLEVGSGIGTVTEHLKTSNYSTWICLEPDFSLIPKSNEWPDGNVHQVCGTSKNMKKIPYFDTALFIDVIEHISDDADEIKRICETVKIGGSVIILAPAFNHIYSKFDKSVGHYRRYSKRSLIDILPKNLVVKEINYVDSIGYFVSVINRFISKNSIPSFFHISFWDRVLIPISKIVDKVINYSFGKTVILVAIKQK
jgi:SAM-dependent methyltransferase